MFQAYVFALHHLSLAESKAAIEALLRRFEWSLLQACGHNFSLVQEAETGRLINAAHYYQFIPGKGIVLATKGIPGAHLLALAADDLTEAEYLKSAKIIMRKAIDQVLGGRAIKARSLFINDFS